MSRGTILKGMALVAVIYGLIVSLPEIKRYIRISSM
jgi:hypothetical protein